MARAARRMAKPANSTFSVVGALWRCGAEGMAERKSVGEMDHSTLHPNVPSQ